MIPHQRANIQIACGLLCLMAGISIYVLWRSSGLLLFRVLDAAGLMDLLHPLRAAAAPYSPIGWLLYALPDGLWAASYVILIDCVFHNQSVATRLAWASVIPAVGCISELLQWPGWMPGTFDTADLICYALPYLLFAIIQLVAAKNKHDLE